MDRLRAPAVLARRVVGREECGFFRTWLATGPAGGRAGGPASSSLTSADFQRSPVSGLLANFAEMLTFLQDTALEGTQAG